MVSTGVCSAEAGMLAGKVIVMACSRWGLVIVSLRLAWVVGGIAAQVADYLGM